MPFSCMSETHVIFSEDYSSSEWEDLKLRIMHGTLSLTLPCCNAKASLRSGLSRRQHFAHLPGESCKSDSWSDYSGDQLRRKSGNCESLDHQRVKEIVKEIAERAGWSAQTEFEGKSPSGDRWTADVFAEKGEFKIVFEIQVSPQQFSYYRIRQQRYRESGIKCVWLSGVTPEFSDEEIPIFELSKSKGVFVVDFPEFFAPSMLKLPKEFTGLSLGEFLQLLLERRILWEHGWVSNYDRLASMEEYQRLPKALPKNAVDNQGVNFGYSSVFSSVKEKDLNKDENPTYKRQPGRQITPSHLNVILPTKFIHESHCLTLMFFSAEGSLLDYYFRGEIGICKHLITQEFKKLPPGSYAEVRDTTTKRILYSEVQQSPQNANCAENPNGRTEHTNKKFGPQNGFRVEDAQEIFDKVKTDISRYEIRDSGPSNGPHRYYLDHLIRSGPQESWSRHHVTFSDETETGHIFPWYRLKHAPELIEEKDRRHAENQAVKQAEHERRLEAQKERDAFKAANAPKKYNHAEALAKAKLDAWNKLSKPDK